ncbi:MAG TPA: V-type ATP synthase subunit I, partial [Spirochaetota bacterium]|nr:V-type ATP synthase subunit I [Spirochaetota bacterium]
VVNRVRQYGFSSAISTIGWIILLLSIVGLAAGDAFGPETGPLVSSVAGYTALVGVALILFFNDLKVNIFVRIGKGVYELYNITGVFGDLLSYVRLFALGISSGILGAVINQLSGQLLGIPVVGVVLYAVALVVGHTGNMLLGMLGSFVHPMRLTFVEFYKSAGFSGGGKEYKPLAAKK